MLQHDKLSSGRKYAIMSSLVLTQLVQMIAYGVGINISIDVGKQLHATQAQATWIAASYPMSQGAFVLIAGRLGDIYGYKLLLLVGATWWVIWTLVSGFAPSVIVLSLFRALTGIGGAFMVPNAVALLAHTFPPGRQRNISMGLFGAMAPIGAAGGSVIGALFVQLSEWKWLFFFLAILGTIVFSGVLIFVPNATASDKTEVVDWFGAYLGVGGLVLFNFVWNQAPIVGWANPYEFILLIVAILHFSMFMFWEARVAKSPILPFSIWTSNFRALIVVVFLAFMSFGIFVWYSNVWMLTTRHMSLLSTAAAVAPLTFGGAVAAFLSAWLISRVSAEHLLGIGALAVLVSSIIVATMPAQQVYWQAMFPAYVIVAFSPDFIFTAAQIVASNSVPRSQQGVAASMIGTLLTYGQSTGLGFGGTVQVYARSGRTNEVQGYKNALYLGIGFAAAALVVSQGFVRIEKDQREGWDIDEPITDTVKSERREGLGTIRKETESQV